MRRLARSATVTSTGTSRPASNPIGMGLAGTITATSPLAGNCGSLTGQQATRSPGSATVTSSRMSSTTTVDVATRRARAPRERAPPGGSEHGRAVPIRVHRPKLYRQLSGLGGALSSRWSRPRGSIRSRSAPAPARAPQSRSRRSTWWFGAPGLADRPGPRQAQFQSTSGTTCSSSWRPADRRRRGLTERERVAGVTRTTVRDHRDERDRRPARPATPGRTRSARRLDSGTTRKVTASNVTNTNFAAPTVVTINLTTSSTQGHAEPASLPPRGAGGRGASRDSRCRARVAMGPRIVVMSRGVHDVHRHVEPGSGNVLRGRRHRARAHQAREVEQELRSACVTSGVTPIQPGARRTI